jgi:hypothetical protein
MMIQTPEEYQKAKDELRQLESWLGELQQDHSLPAKGLPRRGSAR